METRRLAGTDLDVGRLVFGAMTFGTQVDEDAGRAMVEHCREAGVTLFDTANSYGGGRSEEILGSILKPYRDEVQISTKACNPMGSGPDYRGLGAAALTRAVDESLRRLQTDRIDVLFLHKPDWSTPIEETLETLAGLVASGKVLHLGQSNYAAWQITEIAWLNQVNSWPAMLVSQPQYNLLARGLDDEYFACSRRLGLSNIVFNPLAGGMLTGKHSPDATPEPGSRYAADLYRSRYWKPVMFEAVEQLRQVAADAGMSLIELSYRWLLAHPDVDCVLLGASRMEHLVANLAAADGPAPDEGTCARIDEVWATIASQAPSYNR